MNKPGWLGKQLERAEREMEVWENLWKEKPTTVEVGQRDRGKAEGKRHEGQASSSRQQKEDNNR